MPVSANQGRDSIAKLVYHGETFDVQDYGALEVDGELTIYSTGEGTGVHEWIESCDTIQPDGEEEEQLEKLLARDWHE